MFKVLDQTGRFDRNSPQGRAALSAARKWLALRDRLSWLDLSYRINVRPKIPSILLRISDKAKRVAKDLFS